MGLVTDSAFELLLMLFIIITFIQSGVDKIVDWNGNVGWLKEHFSKTFMGKMVPMMLGIILVLEVVCGVLAIGGIYELLINDNSALAIYASVLSGLTLLMLLFGQRVAKDYAGALTIVCYFMVVMLGLFVMIK
ncbi:DoxX family protein [Spongiivirga sp. MCCC 1A20706]|uniref:DoxX family protein n=1 Tax=Spongiivirga sp. MCCC 1A20706 TaxID=3160963 RepID=UPI0039775209